MGVDCTSGVGTVEVAAVFAFFLRQKGGMRGVKALLMLGLKPACG